MQNLFLPASIVTVALSGVIGFAIMYLGDSSVAASLALALFASAAVAASLALFWFTKDWIAERTQR